jgi:hypothetical protein
LQYSSAGDRGGGRIDVPPLTGHLY